MKGIKSALVIGLACCVAATGALARQTGSHSKSSHSSGKKSAGSSAKSRKTKAHKKEARAEHGTESQRLLRGFSDLPPEDLPEADESNDGEQ
jgi:hypothetical protein